MTFLCTSHVYTNFDCTLNGNFVFFKFYIVLMNFVIIFWLNYFRILILEVFVLKILLFLIIGLTFFLTGCSDNSNKNNQNMIYNTERLSTTQNATNTTRFK